MDIQTPLLLQILILTSSPFFPGMTHVQPYLPSIPGDEGVGNVVEIGSLVSAVKVGQRVIVSKPLLGTWCYYGVYDERDVFQISPNIPLAEASMIAAAPSAAYRMIKDFFPVTCGMTVIQNAANSPVGQSVIQICRALGINTFNIVATHCDFELVKANLECIGATTVFTLEEAEAMCDFRTSLQRPILGLNCLGGRYEDVLLKLLDKNGAMVYYGCAYDSAMEKSSARPDLSYYKFNLLKWYSQATCIERTQMFGDISKLIVTGKFKAPMYMPIELKNYVTGIRNTVNCEAFSTLSYVFDFTLP